MTDEVNSGGQPSPEPTSSAVPRSAGDQIADLLPEPSGSTEPERKKKPEAAAKPEKAETEAKADDAEYDPLHPSELLDGDDETEAETESEAEAETDDPGKPSKVSDETLIEWETKSGKQKATVKELQSGYMRDADYRQKTTAHAEERRSFEAEVQQTRAKFNETFQAANAIVEAVVEELAGNAKKPDPNLLRDDPDEYQRQKALYELEQDRINGILERKADLVRRTQAETHGQLVERAKAEAARLVEKLPDFADPKKGPVLKAAIKSYAIKQGFSEEEISGVRDQQGRVVRPGLLDHRAILVLHKAALYDAAVAKRGEVRRKVAAAPTMPAGDGGPSRNERQEERTRKLINRARDSRDTRLQGEAITALL